MSSHKLCMIPGPVEFDQKVLDILSTPATSHVDPQFINTFGNALELMRKVWLAPTGQPFVLAGSGTLTWDMTAANLVEPGENVLVVNTGIFGDWFAECFGVYGAKVDSVTPTVFGDIPTLASIEAQLKQKKYKLISITHVDTSSGVLNDIKGIAELVKKVSPDTLIAVDGVCSVAAEEIRMEDWGLDVVMTASQKAIGVPPGLALMVVSQRALKVANSRVSPPTTYFGSFKKWLPIMQKYEARQGSYFATPPVQLIMALELSLSQFLVQGMDHRFRLHKEASKKFKDAVARFGLKLVPVNDAVAANTLSAIYYPDGVAGGDLLKLLTSHGIVVAGGLHPLHNTKYFRVGHMNVSATELENGHIDKVIAALESSLKSLSKL
ncbi:pyridoxal phosphate-dependent transferase [Globomyces pollinis-pini]|nr:pyridoxal phosphate-dependent transferase [Globomyces pollinis-pini]